MLLLLLLLLLLKMMLTLLLVTAFQRLFSHGEFQADEQEAMLQSLNSKVGEVYRRCIGDNEAGVR